MKIAIVGSGVAGIGAAWLLSQEHDAVIYAKNDYVGGHAREYIRRALTKVREIRASTLTGRVIVRDAHQRDETFDHVVLACHGDQALPLLQDRTAAEAAVLRDVRYKPNRAVVHRDRKLMPKRREVWSSWNYLCSTRPAQRAGAPATEDVCLTYWMSRLQRCLPQDPAAEVLVTLNPSTEPDRSTVLAEFDYDHPVYPTALVQAQARLREIQGVQRTWVCGAWAIFGVHEDGLTSGLQVALALGAKAPFQVVDATHIRPVRA